MGDCSENWIPKKFSKNNIQDSYEALNLQKVFNLPEVVVQILLNRGLKTEKDIFNFLNPRFSNLYKPALLPNIDEASKRLQFAYEMNQKIVIFGDYDTDGVVSTALLYNFLKKTGFNIDYYIPDRFEEGYDINKNFIENIAIPKNYELIICVDRGTNAIDVKKYLKNYTDRLIDVIVCDHHEPLKIVDEAEEAGLGVKSNMSLASSPEFLIINPKLSISKYPFKFLSAAGVVFKFIIHSFNYFDKLLKDKLIKDYSNIQDYFKSMVDLVAISTIADMMPLIDENRVITSFGLKMLSDTCNEGLKKLLEKNFNDRKDFNVYDIGFIVSPRLNASGRIKNAYCSIELLIEDTDRNDSLESIIENLELFNFERQKIQNNILDEIIEIILSNPQDYMINDKKIFVSSSPEWNEGVLGIVASQLVKKLNMPVLLFKEKEMIMKGSGRSIESFNLYSNLLKFNGYFKKFGGHSQACGITIDKSKFAEFKNEIEKYANKVIKTEDLKKKFYYDAELTFKQINEKLIDSLKVLSPWGIENPRPVFRTDGCKIIDTHTVKTSKSQKAKHIFLKLAHEKIVMDAVIFNYFEVNDGGIIENKLKKGSVINILYTLDKKTPLNYLKSTRDNDMLLSCNDFPLQLVLSSFC